MKKTIMSLQHLLAMFGATVLVPILTGFNPSVAIFCAGVGTLIFHFCTQGSVAIFCAGVGTLIFHFCTQGKVPVFLGSSFAFIPVIIAAKKAYGGDLSYAQGGIIVAGLMYVFMSFIVKMVGVDKIKKYFPAHVTGAMIVVIGLNLLPTAFDMASNNILIAFITLSIALIINKFASGFIKQLGILIAVIVGYTICYFSGIIDRSTIINAPLFEMPPFTIPKFSLEAIILIAPVVLAVFMEHIGDMTTNGAVVGNNAPLFEMPPFTIPKFSLEAIILIAPVVLAVFMEHIGDMTTNGAVVGKNFIENPGLNKTLLGDGLATIVAGFLGGPANTTYGENTAVLAITKNYDPSLLRRTALFAIVLSCIGKFGGFLQSIPQATTYGENTAVLAITKNYDPSLLRRTALFAIVLSCIGKFGGFLQSIPQAVMGGISILLFSMITLVGCKTVKDSNCIENKNNIIIIATIMIIGLGTTYLGNKGITIGIPITKSVMITGLSLAAIVGIVLNRILNNKEFKNNKLEEVGKIEINTI